MLKHSQAGKVELELELRDGLMKISFGDNGIGFDEGKIQEAEGTRFGLQNMRHRIDNLGGSFVLSTRPGRGVMIRIELPAVLKEHEDL